MEHTLSFYSIGELRSQRLIPSESTMFLDLLRSAFDCYLTRGGDLWDYHFVSKANSLSDPTVVLEALNLLEARIYLIDTATLFLPPEKLTQTARNSLIRQLERGAQIELKFARAELALHEKIIEIITCRIMGTQEEYRT